MFRIIVAFALSSVLVACQPEIPTASAAEGDQRSAAPEYLNANPRAPYSEGVRYGGLIFLAGKTGGSGESGVQPETRRALESIKDALERFDSSMDRVLKCTVFLADMAEWGAMNEIYAEYFPVNKPARTAVGISLGGDTRVEIECIAAG
jgi:2-iminobutanoate/2-iminopropanoate deaminase